MQEPLKILMLEDNAADAEIVQRLLKKGNGAANIRLAMTRQDYIEALDNFNPDIILADNSLPQFDASQALKMINERSLHIPFILITGTVSEEFAADIIKQGADDYILKDRLIRLPAAIEAAVKQRKSEKEKINATRQLIESEEKYRTLVEHAFDGIIIYSPDGIILDCNHSACSYLGYTQKELKALTIPDLFFKEDLVKRPLRFESLKAGHPTLDYRRLKKKNGSFIEMEIGTKMMPDGKLMAIGRDITDRKKAEDEIRLSNERYTTVAKATSDAIWDYDFALNKTYIAGTGYKDLFGYNIVNEYSEDGFWEARIHPADKKLILADLAETIADSNISQSQAEYRFLKADGSYAYINDRFFILRDSNGKPIRMLGAKQDITLRKKAEEQSKKSFDEKRALAERMSAILNTLPANIALLNEKGIIVDVNDAWRNFAGTNGFAGASYGIGDNYVNVSRMSFGENKTDGRTVSGGIKDVLQNSVKEFVFEYAWHTPLSQKWFRMVATPLRDREYVGAVVMHIDISELRKLEQERLVGQVEEQKKITRAMLRAQEKERNQLGQELHDNINQLLAAIKMKLAYCLRHYEKGIPAVVECMEYVQEAIVETRNLSHRMVMPRFAENSFKQALKQLTENYQNEKRTVKLETIHLEEKRIPATIKETLFRIVQEQLNNIEKYADASDVTVQVAGQPEQLTMLLGDNGNGFDINKKRTGIGLTNILNRVESYNGSASIISEPGKGCQLLIEVPLNGKNDN
jgi:PAS domain S-box-containing protein